MNKKRILIVGIFIILFILVLSIILSFVILKKGYSSQWYDIIALVVNNFTILCIFVITYLLVDSSTVKKEENKYNLAKYLIKSAYKTTEEVLSFYTQETIIKYVLPKVDGNKTFKDNLFVLRLEELPFKFENHLFDLVKDGVLSEKEFKNYLKLKQLYVTFIEMAITFPDVWQRVEPYKKELEYYIKENKNNYTL